MAWKGEAYKCRHCEAIIFSRYAGEYVQCSCGAVAVDQTPEYMRIIGDINALERVEENERKES